MRERRRDSRPRGKGRRRGTGVQEGEGQWARWKGRRGGAVCQKVREGEGRGGGRKDSGPGGKGGRKGETMRQEVRGGKGEGRTAGQEGRGGYGLE